MALCKTVIHMFNTFSVFLITYIYLLLNHYANDSKLNASQLKYKWKQGCIHSFGKYKLRVYLKYIKVDCVGRM